MCERLALLRTKVLPTTVRSADDERGGHKRQARSRGVIWPVWLAGADSAVAPAERKNHISLIKEGQCLTPHARKTYQ